MNRSRSGLVISVLLLAALCAWHPYTAQAGSSPTVAVYSPLGALSTWIVNIDWGDADTCQYAIDSTDSADLVTMDACDNSIPAPAAGSHYLHLVATNSSGSSVINAIPFDYEPPNNPPVAGWNDQPTQASPSDTTVTPSVHLNDTESDPVSITVRYSLDGGSTWTDAGHLSGASFPTSGNTISSITTYGDGINNRANVAFYWDFTDDASTASTTDAELEITPHDARGDGDAIVSDPFTLKAPPAPPVFADDSGAVTDVTENSVIVHYDMSSVGSAPLHHFELDYASDDYYTAHSDYAENTPITYTASFADSGATNIDGLACGTEYH
ncbi:MAG TPA: hypothetical protein VHB93_02140, partial [Candidatus Paceibacterota bacterium]|nr:hypothetical protein [Candidatus Paceibacterota bacterium]